jgi:predicted porin
MQKKIIALAVASALTVPAMAFAEATLTGQVNMSYDYVNDGAASSTTTNQLTSNNTRMIWKGSEDLGGGLAGIWQLDARIQADNGVNTSTTANQLFSGNNYLGLKGDSWGTLMAGRMDAPYKVATRSLDVFFDTAGDNRSSNGSATHGLLTHDARTNNSLAYMSPDMSGFSILAATVFGAETAKAATPATAATQTQDKKGSAYSLAGVYNAGPINVSLSYQEAKLGGVGSGDLGAATAPEVDDKDTAMKLAGGYKTDAFTINALFEQTKLTFANGDPEEKHTNYYLGGIFNMTPADAIRLAYTKRGAASDAAILNGADGSASQYALGYQRMMSKTTSAYVTYVKTNDDTVVGSVGNPDPSDISIGVKHAF